MVPLSKIFCIVTLCLMSCSHLQPEAIHYGVDACMHCKMTISDTRFGAEFVTKKGRDFKFDDIQCMMSYVKENNLKKEDIAGFYIADFKGVGELKAISEMFFLKSAGLKSPMGGNVAALNSENERDSLLQQMDGSQVDWDELW